MPVAVADAYRKETADLRPFYSAWPREIFNRQPITGPCWPGLCEEVEAYHASIDNTPVEWGDCFVVTGQQPALFTGPLYTIYKIATAIRLAAEISKRQGVRCTPVYWQGSDDHDFNEARSATVLTRGHEPLTLAYEPLHDVAGLPMYRVPLDTSAHDLVDRAADSTSGAEFREDIRAFLHDSLNASPSLANWNARLIARLFASSGLVIFTSESRSARLAATEILRKEILDPLATTRLVNEAGARLCARNYEQQVSKGADECGFFLEVDGRRCKITFRDGAFLAPTVGLRFTPDELLGVLDAEPDRFSPNVAMRCIVQQRLFPVVAYVAGPGEIAYWGQFKPLFEYFDVPMPVVYPRAQCLLTSSKLNKLRSKLGLDAAHVVDWSAPDDIVTHALRKSADNPFVTALQKRKTSIEKELRELEQDLAKAPVPAATLSDRVTDAIENYERILMRADEARYDTVRQQITRLCNTFAPFRKPQERVYTIFSFLFEHGWDLVPRIVRDIDIESFGITEIEL